MTDRSVEHGHRVEQFAELLDGASTAGGHVRSPHDHELVALVTLRHRIEAAAPQTEIDQDFRRALRATLMATAVRDGIGVTARPARTTPLHRRVRTPLRTFRRPRARPSARPRISVKALAGIAASVIAFAGLPHASESALPGDALYGLKRSAERAQVALAGSDISRGHLHLDLARTRLEEARTVTSGVHTLLADMDDDTRHGIRLLTAAATARRDPAPLDAIDHFTGTQRGPLDELAGQVNGTDRARATGSLRLLDRIDERSASLRHNLACPSPSVTRVDTLGPELGSCAAAMPLPYSLKKPPRQQPDGLSPRRDVAERPPWAPANPAARPAPDLPAPAGQSSATTPPTTAPSTSPTPDQDGPPGGGKPPAVPPPPAGDPPGQGGNPPGQGGNPPGQGGGQPGQGDGQPEQGDGQPEQGDGQPGQTQPQAAQLGPPEHVLLLRATQLGPPGHQPAHPAQPHAAGPHQATPPDTPEQAAQPGIPAPAAQPDRPKPAAPPNPPEQVAGAAAEGLPSPDSGGKAAGEQEGTRLP